MKKSRWDEIRQMLQVRNPASLNDADYDAAKMMRMEEALLAIIYELEQFSLHKRGIE